MFDKVKWRKFKDYSGPLIRGTSKFELSNDAKHWDRVVWLTSKVETGGKFGSVMAYDGTCQTAGIIQGIGVYPRELAHEDNNPEDDQGPLWAMLNYIRKDCPDLTKRIEEEFFQCGWVLDKHCLRTITDDAMLGPPVNGRILREELTPNQGRVPRYGADWDTARGWALLFYEIFSDPRSFDAQIRFGIDHAHKTAKRRPFVLNGKNIASLVYNNDLLDTKLFGLDDPMDLAMAFLFSNSVNAPAMAFRRLKQAFNVFGWRTGKRPNWQNKEDRFRFARRLVRVLGISDFGRWNFKFPSGRYQRSRIAAKEVWPKEFFTGPYTIMPRRF